MEKRKLIFGVIAAILLLCGIGLIWAVHTRITLQPVEIKRNEDCNYIGTLWNGEIKNIQFYWQDGLFSESEMKNQLYTLKKLISKCDTKRTTKVYVLNDWELYAIGQSKDVVFLDKEDIESGDYLYCIICSLYDLKINTPSLAFFEYLNDTAFDNDKIKTFLSNEQNQYMLDFFYLRSRDDYAKENAAIFREIVASFASTMFENDKWNVKHLDKLEITDALINMWLTDVGLDISNDSEVLASSLSRLDFKKEQNVELYIQSGQLIWQVDDFEEIFGTLDIMSDYLAMEIQFSDQLFGLLRDNGLTSIMQEPTYKVIHKYNMGSSARSYSYSEKDQGRIELTTLHYDTTLHELAHCFIGMIEPEINQKAYWVNEGIAIYLPRVLLANDKIKQRYNDLLTVDDPVVKATLETYKKRFGVTGELKKVDYQKYRDAYLITYWQGEHEEFNQYPIVSMSFHERRQATADMEGHELSYREAESFVAYLIDNYSFATVWNYMVDQESFEDEFGKTYSLAKKEWQMSLR